MTAIRVVLYKAMTARVAPNICKCVTPEEGGAEAAKQLFVPIFQMFIKSFSDKSKDRIPVGSVDRLCPLGFVIDLKTYSAKI